MDWGMDGSFMSRPKQGWLHAGQQLQPDAGVRYIVKYIGSITVLESMRLLDIDTRTAVTNESINRIGFAYNSSSNLRKNVKLDRYLGDDSDIRLCGVQVSLTIDTDCLSIASLESGDLLFQHLMPTISFASGGEPPSQDFVAYVAKSDDGARLSHVFECRSGLARDVITTIGQVFEIRFKTYLSQRGSSTNSSHPIPDCVPIPPVPPPQEPLPPPPPLPFFSSHEAQYYNERSDVTPPSPEFSHSSPHPPPLPPPISHHHHHHHHHRDGGGSGMDDNIAGTNTNGFNNNNNKSICNFCQQQQQHTHLHHLPHRCHHHHANQLDDVGCGASNIHISPTHDGFTRRNSDKGNHICSPTSFSSPHLRSTESFHSAPESTMHTAPLSNSRPTLSPYNEIWFHGRISRPKAEELLHRPGDFLVRESPNSPGQFVLSGRQGASSKHLLLVDPEGKVRTKDQLFNSVSHLVNYHLYNQIPIISNDSQLLLINPIHCTILHN